MTKVYGQYIMYVEFLLELQWSCVQNIQHKLKIISSVFNMSSLQTS